MIRAIDTNILVYLAASDVPQHGKTRRTIERFISRSPENRLAVTEDVLLEFVHVVPADEPRARWRCANQSALARRSASTPPTASRARRRHSRRAALSQRASGRASIGSPRAKRRRVLRERLGGAVATR